MKENAISNLATEVFIDELECLRRVPVSRRTWFTWRRIGKVPSIKLGRRTLYHWPSVEAALLRMQRGGVMVFIFLFAAFALSAMGHTSILEVSLQSQSADRADRKLLSGNTTGSQTTNRNANAVSCSSRSVSVRNLTGVVAAMCGEEVGEAIQWNHRSLLFLTAWDSRFKSLEQQHEPPENQNAVRAYKKTAAKNKNKKKHEN